MRAHRLPQLRGGEIADGAEPEAAAHDGCALDHRALPVLEPVEAGREERLDRRRHGKHAAFAFLGCHRGHLLDEERVPFRRSGDVHPDLGREALADREEERFGLSVRQRVEHEGVGVRTSGDPRGVALDEVRARKAEEQHGCVANPAREVLDQVEERRLGPVDVLEAHDERARPGKRLEQLADRPERLLARRARARGSERAQDTFHHEVGVG